jgi:DNA polymerase
MSAATRPKAPETVVLAHPTDLEGWRGAARRLAVAEMPPADVLWSVAGDDETLFSPEAPSAGAATGVFAVPRAFLDLAETVIQHRDPERFALLYAALWRIRHGERELLANAADPLVARLQRMVKAVRHEAHKMTAFVRFREIAAEEGPRYLAWFEPEHHVLKATAPFFVRQFAGMRWSILTPDKSAHWDGTALRFGRGGARADAPAEDALEEVWRTYYRSIFNPARLNKTKMRADMPQRYWRNLPEAQLIPELTRDAVRRTRAMLDQPPTPASRPEWAPAAPAVAAPVGGLAALHAEAASCRRCPLWESATQTVFGEGPPDAALMLVGEQPGDQEDLAGHAFVGPAGRLLDEALAAAGLDRAKLYVTNAVKHFKFEPRGRRRIHQKPDRSEVRHCRWWLAPPRTRSSAAQSVSARRAAASSMRPAASACW